MAISTISITMMIVARGSISFPLSISMMVISWLSYGSSEEGKGNSNQKIHLLVGLN